MWHIASPVDPDAPPRAVRYPQAGSDNADVSLSILGLDGSRVDVDWDRDAFPYLVEVTWNDDARSPCWSCPAIRSAGSCSRPTPTPGKTQALIEHTAEHWQTIVAGVPDRLSDGRLVFVEENEDTCLITLDGEPVTPAGLQVASVLDVGDDILFAAQDDPTELHVWRTRGDGAGSPERLTTEPGVHTAARAGDLMVVVSDLADRRMRRAVAFLHGAELAEIRSHVESP